ncbi:hypothetical protein [Sporosarcina sp. ITBMC105]
MKKWIVLLSMLIVLVGCNEKQEESPIDSPPDEQDGTKDVDREGSFTHEAILEGADMAAFFLEDGATAHFHGEGNEFATYTTRMEWLDERHVNVYENNGGVELAKSYRIDDDRIVLLREEPLQTENETVSIEEIKELKSIRPYLIFPLEVGDEIGSWTVVSVDETVETPMQQFEQVIVLEETFEDGAVSRSYFAIGFGEIKRSYSAQDGDNPFEVTSEIESIE